ncbi:MAG TPA: hypothetical protein VMU84_07025 [Thermoanaerobaculia bacterium]|nr:hypothetical protein [Thermoanaerobaculia bacterium]
MPKALAAALALTLSTALYAQSPSADWRTVTTEHFRVHYPAPYEAWSLRVASRLESIRDAVSKEVGYAPKQTVDVIVMNPIADANGLAFPLLDTPRIIFYTEPPGPEEQLGAYNEWIDLLAVHEFAHTAHMLRPSRNPLQRALERFVVPLDPITLHAPRWVLEGYATVIEGRLTGAGRPNSTLRAIILRKWAQGGRLPTYAQLNSDRRFLGMSMAYLAGSAFLEWLEQRSGPESLRNLWARMTARHRRGFNEAFQGVFGESPDRLYGRFVAELTESALIVERTSHDAELWQETSRGAGDPVVSPDGTKIAIVLRPRDEPARLVIWSTGPAEKEEKKYSERIAEILKRDPEDVGPVRAKPLTREPLHSLTPRDGGDIVAPRWTRDGSAILYAHRQPDAEGFLHFDLFRWTPESGEVVRLTQLADVRDADPDPDGATAVAVRNRNGFSQLVRVSLDGTGTITPITEPSIEAIYNHPRVSPDGKLAYLKNHTLECGGHAAALGGDIASPEWISNTELIATISSKGFAELNRITCTGDAIALTRSTGGAFEPAPASDGRVFFMSLEPDGYVVRVTKQDAAPPQVAIDRPLFPALPPTPPRVQPFATQALPPSKPYALGRQEFGWFLGQNYTADQHSTEIGIRFGDVIGRLDTLAIVSIGDDSSAALITAWRGWPVEILAHAYEDGLEFRGAWSHRAALRKFTIEAGALGGDRSFPFIESALRLRQLRGNWRIEEELRAAAEFGDEPHQRVIARGSISVGSLRVTARYQRDRAGESTITLGGLATSILPRSALASQVLDPALPVATLTGDRYDGRRIEVVLPGFPVTAFYQQHRLSTRLTLAGIEFAISSEPYPILKLPGVDITAGAARVLDEPLRGRTKWWLNMRWRP